MGTMTAVTATGTPDEPASTIHRLYGEHQRAAFPDRWCDEDVAGVDLVLLDAHVAGCVVRRQAGEGPFGAAHREVLGQCLGDLDRVLLRLTDGHERRYAERLRDLARLLVQADG
jgi:hypothetical protein